MKDYEYYKKRVDRGDRFEDPEILELSDNDGWSIAHEQALNGWTTEDPEILKLTNKCGDTVAHTQAYEGWTTEDNEILKLKNDFGRSVAHEQALNGWTTENNEILKLKDKFRDTVEGIQRICGWKPKEEIKMKVYLIQDEAEYEGATPLVICSTKEKAEYACNFYNCRGDTTIHVMEMDHLPEHPIGKVSFIVSFLDEKDKIFVSRQILPYPLKDSFTILKPWNELKVYIWAKDQEHALKEAKKIKKKLIKNKTWVPKNAKSLQ